MSKKNKKENKNIAIHVCKVVGDIKNLDEQLKKSDDVLFAEALKRCKITDPVYFCRIKEPLLIEDLTAKLFESGANGKYDGHDAYVIIPALTYPKNEFKKLINYTQIEKLTVYEKPFYVFVKHDVL